MGNPYTDRMNEITRLRAQWALIERAIGDEVAKAWRLSPISNLEVFADSLQMEPESVRQILQDRGIIVRSQTPIPESEV